MRKYYSILVSSIASVCTVMRRILPLAADRVTAVTDNSVVIAKLQTEREPSRRQPSIATAKITTERQLERLNQRRPRNIK